MVATFQRDNNNSNITNSLRKKKPMPPPRSSMPKLTTVDDRTIGRSIDPIKSYGDTNDGIRHKGLISHNTAMIKYDSKNSNINNESKVISPPDPLRSLKQSIQHSKS